MKLVLDIPGKGCDWDNPPANVFEGSAIAEDAPVSTFNYETVITHDGSEYEGRDDRCWEAEVFVLLGMGMRSLLPAMTRKLTRLEMLTLAMDAAPGEADCWIRNLLCDEDAEYIIRHFYSRASTI